MHQERKNREIVAILHNIRSLQNVGSIFRTADGAGIKKIYLCGITPAPVDRFGKPRQRLTKVSLGAEEYVEWESAKSAAAVIRKLKKDGYKILAVEQSRDSVPYREFKVSAEGGSSFGGKGKKLKVALIVGNEVAGIPKSILKLADKILEIPMRGAMVRQAHHPRHIRRGKESLNVSVAFGIVVYAISCGGRGDAS